VKQSDVPCPICGRVDYRVLYRPWRTVSDPVHLFGAASGERGTQQIVQCRSDDCGMIYVSPRYEDSVIFSGYENALDEHDSQYESRVDTFFRSLKKNAALLPPPGCRVLDIGCAGGAYLQAAGAYGYRAVGLEPSLFLTESCRKRGLQVMQGTLESYQRSDKFDLVSLWDVLEHVTDPSDVLNKCRSLLREKGVLLVNYPDVGTWSARLAGRSFWWFLSVHLHYFDRRTIRRILEKQGYEILSMRRHIQRLECGYLLDVARIYNAPVAALAARTVPAFLKRLSIPYYASQTTVLARTRS
jgi:SAM-dependent methyltransferase